MELICFTSPKGSCGASFCTSEIAGMLAKSGYRCLVADLRHNASTLAMYFGCEDNFVYNLSDVAEGRCSFKDAVIENVCTNDLDFVSTSTLIESDSIQLDELISILRKNSSGYDYVLADVSFDILKGNILSQNDTVIYVTDSNRANVSVLERCLSSVETEAKSYLLVNKVIPELIADGFAMNIDDICDLICLPPIGIVPMDHEADAYTNSGILSVTDKNLLSTKALWNIAERIKGNRIPAVDFDYKTQYYKKIKNISNRR